MPNNKTSPNSPRRVMIVFGTRPEAIKCIPVIHALQTMENVELTVCVTGQHRELLDKVLAMAKITPQVDLNLMTPGQTLPQITSRVLERLPQVIEAYQPDVMLVQGDTTTAFAAALTAFYHKVPVGHIEAGLRSHQLYNPWPEEANRKLAAVLTRWHFAPTETAKQNLLKEGVDAKDILVTGNTVIDALHFFLKHIHEDKMLSAQFAAQFSYLSPTKKLIVVTTHRREHFDGGIERICHALKRLSERPDVQLVFPVHPNPNVRGPVETILGEAGDVALIPPLDYLPFLYLMEKATLILSDSGGVQEEAPALGKPVLVLRETTERPEGVEAGTALLVGTDAERIVAEANRLLDDESAYQKMSRAHNPYGDGKASGRICQAILPLS